MAGGRQRAGGAGAAPAPVWAVVLAGGAGRRLQGLTHARGEPAPKQFSSLGAGVTLLGSALERAGHLAAPERIVPVVVREHRRWWEDELSHLPADNVVVQPGNRGTAVAILLALLRIARRDPAAVVLVLPSDHHFEREAAIRAALALAVTQVRREARRVLLLGVTPEGPEEGLGWILPAAGRGELLVPLPVAEFREKPAPGEAAALLERGAVANIFLLAARAAMLRQLYGALLPELTAALEDADRVGTAPELERVFGGLASLDFSRDLLERASERLSVMRVPPCGWTDLGTPERLARCLAGRRRDPSWLPPATPRPALSGL